MFGSEVRMRVRHSVSLGRGAAARARHASHARQQPPVGVPVPPLGAGPWVIRHRRAAQDPRERRDQGALASLGHRVPSRRHMLITERAGRLRFVRDGVLDPQPISGVPQVRTDGNGGLMDVALHPQFADNRLVYFTYTKPVGNSMGAPALARGRLEGHALVDVQDLLVPDVLRGQLGSQRPCRLRA